MMSLLPLMIRRRYMHNHAKDVDSRRDLLGIQYRAMGRLMWIIIGYIGVSYVASFLFLVVFIYLSPNLKEIIAQQGVSGPASFASFHVISSFNNAGFSLFSTNLIPFRDASVVLMVLGALILLGNTLYPVALRSIVCLFRKYASREHGRDEYQYLLDHPRECFTHLFPELNTHILLITSIVFNCFEMILFIAYDWNLAILNGSSWAEKFFAGVFSSVSTRTAGFNVVDLAVISPTLQFVQLLLMYVASVPGIVTLRSSTVVGVDTIQVAEDDEETALEKIPSSFKRILVWFRNRNFMLREASLLLVFVLLICFVEDPKLSNDANFTIFKVLYESASGFGTVGLSLGYPNTVTSLSAQFNAAAKIFMCCIMLLGRHRGLPTSLDPAVQLTSDNKELELNSTRAHLQNEFSEFNKFDQEGRLVPVVPPQISPSDVRLRRVKTYA
jgi:Trk-type K+ transport system membrane component